MGPWVRASGEPVPPALQRDVVRHAAADTLVPLVQALLEAPPRVLHCWLDHPNAVGGLAGVLAGVPRVVLSTRNVNPRHFSFFRPWFRDSYRLLVRSPVVVVVANSRAGGDDYARWAGFDPARISVVPNGIPADEYPCPSGEERRAARQRFGLHDDEVVIVSIGRLAPEKRPLDLLEVTARARAGVPGLRHLHVGTGPLEPAVRDRARELGLGSTISFPGFLEDPRPAIAAADLSLLTSEWEGCPNALLESQAMGLPVIATDAGGTSEAVLDGETGHLHPIRRRGRARAIGRRPRSRPRAATDPGPPGGNLDPGGLRGGDHGGPHPRPLSRRPRRPGGLTPCAASPVACCPRSGCRGRSSRIASGPWPGSSPTGVPTTRGSGPTGSRASPTAGSR